MTLESDAVAGATIELLEARLRRLSYLLTGATEWTGVPTTPEKPASLDETVSRRLARLERELEKLSRSVPAVRDVIQLRMYSAIESFTSHLTPIRIVFTSFLHPIPTQDPVLVYDTKQNDHTNNLESQTTASQTSSNPDHPTKSPKASQHAPSHQ